MLSIDWIELVEKILGGRWVKDDVFDEDSVFEAVCAWMNDVYRIKPNELRLNANEGRVRECVYVVVYTLVMNCGLDKNDVCDFLGLKRETIDYSINKCVLKMKEKTSVSRTKKISHLVNELTERATQRTLF